MSSETFDYIIIGAGIAGTVICSRLHERDPSLKILLIEAGPDSSKTPLAPIIANPSKVVFLKGSEVDWNYFTEPQKHLNGLEIYAGAGKAIGGGSVINYGVWARGDSKDYDDWAKIVDSPRFSWEEVLPYFKKIETHFDLSDESEVHGHHGPVLTASVSSSGRDYALREPLREAWAELGVHKAEDINNGSPLGMAEIVEARTKGQRVITSAAYPLTGITILSSTMAQKILFTTCTNGEPKATAIELANGRTFTCNKEIILSAGSFRTPQLLLLSGIGPSSSLSQHSIPQIVESPDVGGNLWDHLGIIQQWKLSPHYASLASSVGSPAWSLNPKFQTGNPIEWYTTTSVPSSDLHEALLKDGYEGEGGVEEFGGERCHLAFIVRYFGGTEPDGTVVSTAVLNLLPTSRGRVGLRSRDVKDSPVIDPHFFETEADRFRLRMAAKTIAKLWDTKAGREVVVGEVLPEGMKTVGKGSTDEEIDERIKGAAGTIHHPAGTASMGRVVDTEFRVKGVDGLRVVDASVIPTPLTAPFQACVYALGEMAVDLILGKK